MLLWLAQYFQDYIGPLRVFNYITFRAVFATITAIAIGLICGPAVIRKLTAMKVGQAVRTYGPQTHLAKHGTPTMGGVFVAETLSVIIQVTWFKYTKKRYGAGRRVFLMAPLHHHFEQKGWKETKVVVRFWIVTMMLVLIGLSTLKLR